MPEYRDVTRACGGCGNEVKGQVSSDWVAKNLYPLAHYRAGESEGEPFDFDDIWHKPQAEWPDIVWARVSKGYCAYDQDGTMHGIGWDTCKPCMEKRSQQRYEEAMEESRVPQEYDFRFDQLRVPPNNPAYVKALDALYFWATQREEEDTRDWLLLLSDERGTGKSALLGAIAHALAHAAYMPVYCEAEEILDWWRTLADNGASDGVKDEARSLSGRLETRTFLIDEFAQYDGTEKAMQQMERIVEHRYRERMTTVFATNESPARLKEYSRRIESRLLQKNLTLVVHLPQPFKGKSWRDLSQKEIEKCPLYVDVSDYYKQHAGQPQG